MMSRGEVFSRLEIVAETAPEPLSDVPFYDVVSRVDQKSGWEPMLDSLVVLGRQLVRDGAKALDPYIKPTRRARGELYLVRVIFDVDKDRIISDPLKCTEELAKQYLWVGNTLAASRERVARLTTDNVNYLTDPENNLIANMRAAIRDLRRIQPCSSSVDELDQFLARIQARFLEMKDFKTLTEKAVGDFRRRAYLYTVCMRADDKTVDLAKTAGYKEFLLTTLKSPGQTMEGTCYVCGRRGQVLADPAFPSASLLKTYAKDQKGFTSGIMDSDMARLRTFATCPDCRMHLLQAWYYVRNRLTTENVQGIKTYLIPRTLTTLPIPEIDQVCDYIKNSYEAISSFDGLQQFEKRFIDILSIRDRELWYSLTIVFGSPETAHFGLKTLVQDVPGTRITLLRDVMNRLERLGQQELGGKQETWSLGFNDIYHIFPLGADARARTKEHGPLLSLFQAMLTASRFPYERLVMAAVKLARIHRHESYVGSNIRPPHGSSDSEMCVGVLKFNLLVRMLRDVGVLEGMGEPSDLADEGTEQLPDDVVSWFRETGYIPRQKALFLLGCLVGEVGRAQYRKGDRKKSILEKIDFNGMGKERIMELANSVLRSLRDYRILDFNEKLYHQMKSLLDRHIRELRSDPVENVYYLLSGYAFTTYRGIVMEG